MALDEIKTHLNETLTLRSKTPALVQQEFYALLLAHAVVRHLMAIAAADAHQAAEDLSFVSAVRVLQRRLPAASAIPPSAEHDGLKASCWNSLPAERQESRHGQPARRQAQDVQLPVASAR